jgi:hypothetical protein
VEISKGHGREDYGQDAQSIHMNKTFVRIVFALLALSCSAEPFRGTGACASSLGIGTNDADCTRHQAISPG